VCIIMLFASWEVCIVKSCDSGLEKCHIIKSEVSVFEHTKQPQLVINLFIFALSVKSLVDLFHTVHTLTHCVGFTMTVCRDRKIQTPLRTNKIGRFVTILNK